MEQITKSSLLRFNEELLLLSKAGISFGLGEFDQLEHDARNGEASDSAETILARVNAFLKESKLSDESIAQAISDNFPNSRNYCRAVAILSTTGSESLALEQLRFPARTKSAITRTIGNSLIYPSILLVFVALGFSVICLFTTPTITNLYEQVQQELPTSVQVLENGRRYLPVWGTALPVAMILFWVWWHRAGKSRSWTWLPGNTSYYQTAIKAHSAHLLGQLLSKGCNPKLAIELASPHKRANTTHIHGLASSASGDSITSLPPLMQWAIQRSDANEQSLQDSLSVVSEIYAKSATRQTRSWRSLLPTILGILFGGLIVFAYSFSLFAPVIEVLYDLASPLGGLSDP